MRRDRAGLLVGIVILFLAVAAILSVGQASAQPPRPTFTASPTATAETTPTVTPTATATPAPTATPVVEYVPLRDDPLIRGQTLLILLLTVIVGGILLLGLMVCARAWSRKPATGQGAVADQDKEYEGTYKRQIEGIILVMVVVAIILLGVTDKIGQEGLVSVLAAITGYAVGRAASETGK